MVFLKAHFGPKWAIGPTFNASDREASNNRRKLVAKAEAYAYDAG